MMSVQHCQWYWMSSIESIEGATAVRCHRAYVACSGASFPGQAFWSKAELESTLDTDDEDEDGDEPLPPLPKFALQQRGELNGT